ncbi:MAG: 30S ribosomal protein S27ae [Candidatus Aenigmarchaeota archaeon]|nr:30S ribosomal protein S27ae [Candidatus Aenigmarchaeota archaeon]
MKHRPVQQHKYFSVNEGKVERKMRYCPRCGVSILGQHKNRLSCGKCGYAELLKV